MNQSVSQSVSQSGNQSTRVHFDVKKWLASIGIPISRRLIIVGWAYIYNKEIYIETSPWQSFHLSPSLPRSSPPICPSASHSIRPSLHLSPSLPRSSPPICPSASGASLPVKPPPASLPSDPYCTWLMFIPWWQECMYANVNGLPALFVENSAHVEFNVTCDACT